MATKAYLLVETSVGKTREVAATLGTLDGVESVDVVTGQFDIIAVINAADLTAIGAMVTENIHTISGIVRTQSCVAVGAI